MEGVNPMLVKSARVADLDLKKAGANTTAML